MKCKAKDLAGYPKRRTHVPSLPWLSISGLRTWSTRYSDQRCGDPVRMLPAQGYSSPGFVKVECSEPAIRKPGMTTYMSHRQHQVVDCATPYIRTYREEHPLGQLFVRLEQGIETPASNSSSQSAERRSFVAYIDISLDNGSGVVPGGRTAAGRVHLQRMELPSTLAST